MNRATKQKILEVFLSRPQLRDYLGFLEPTCQVLKGYIWTPNAGLRKVGGR